MKVHLRSSRSRVHSVRLQNTLGLEFIGADRIGQVPKGQSSKLLSGYAFDIIGKRKVLNYDRQRKSEEAVIEVQVTNSRTEPVQVRIVEHINGDWVVKNESHNYIEITLTQSTSR